MIPPALGKRGGIHLHRRAAVHAAIDKLLLRCRIHLPGIKKPAQIGADGTAQRSRFLLGRAGLSRWCVLPLGRRGARAGEMLQCSNACGKVLASHNQEGFRLIEYLNPFFDLVSNARLSRLDKDLRHRLIELQQELPLARQPKAQWPSPVHRWSAIPTLPLYTPTPLLSEVGY
jgi:hypothetical protein